MAKRKLTPKVKADLYKNRWRVRKSDYTGEALAYLTRLRAASKAAKTKKANTAKIGTTVIPKSADLYRVIAGAAKAKGQTIAKFIKENKKEIAELLKNDRVVITRETRYAIDDITHMPARSKIFINGEKVSKGDAIYSIQDLTSTSMMLSNIVVVNYEMSYDLAGNLYMEIPMPEDYDDLLDDLEDLDEEEREEEWDAFLDKYDAIIYIKSNRK